MANKASSTLGIQDRLQELNESLAGVSPYLIVAIDPKEINLIDKNARYMPNEKFAQLVANIKRDGNLASMPLLEVTNGRYECLSGNHRVQASVAAKIPLILCYCIEGPLSLSEKRAIQISHNSLSGLDVSDTLKELYNEIEDVMFKEYAGIDDVEIANLPTAHLMSFNDDGLKFERVELLFVCAEVERIKEVVKWIGKKSSTKLLGNAQTFDLFFEKLLEYKEIAEILSSETAFMEIIKVMEREIASLKS